MSQREHIKPYYECPRCKLETRALQCFETTRTKPETKSEDAFDSSNINSGSRSSPNNESIDEVSLGKRKRDSNEASTEAQSVEIVTKDTPARVSPVQEATEEEKTSSGAEAVNKGAKAVQVKKEEKDDEDRPLRR